MPDRIEKGAQEIADVMEKGRTEEVEDRLRSDYLSMKPEDFRKLVHGVQSHQKEDSIDHIDFTDNADGTTEVIISDSTKWWFNKSDRIVGTPSENQNARTVPGAGLKQLQMGDNDQYRGNVIEQQH